MSEWKKQGFKCEALWFLDLHLRTTKEQQQKICTAHTDNATLRACVEKLEWLVECERTYPHIHAAEYWEEISVDGLAEMGNIVRAARADLAECGEV
jgi:hypothetical protein